MSTLCVAKATRLLVPSSGAPQSRTVQQHVLLYRTVLRSSTALHMHVRCRPVRACTPMRAAHVPRERGGAWRSLGSAQRRQAPLPPGWCGVRRAPPGWAASRHRGLPDGWWHATNEPAFPDVGAKRQHLAGEASLSPWTLALRANPAALAILILVYPSIRVYRVNRPRRSLILKAQPICG